MSRRKGRLDSEEEPVNDVAVIQGLLDKHAAVIAQMLDTHAEKVDMLAETVGLLTEISADLRRDIARNLDICEDLTARVAALE